MSTQAVRAVRSVFAFLGPTMMWTWRGVFFGKRRGNSLFTYDGVEVGRFFGTEIYAMDGKYLGELKTAHGRDRLLTSIYKKSQIAGKFMPTLKRAGARAPDLAPERLYCGYEDFPSPETLQATVFQLQRQLRSYVNANRSQ